MGHGPTSTSTYLCGWQASTDCCYAGLRAQGAQFAVSEVEVVSATVDLDEVVSYRGGIASLQQQVCSPVVTLLGCAMFRLQCVGTGHIHLKLLFQHFCAELANLALTSRIEQAHAKCLLACEPNNSWEGCAGVGSAPRPHRPRGLQAVP